MENNRRIKVIDFESVKYYLQFHRILKEALDFPDYYGENWDTLRALLPETAEKFVEILQEWTQYVRDLHTGDIQIHFMEDRQETIL